MYEYEHGHTICERHVVKEINYKKFVKKEAIRCLGLCHQVRKEDYFNSIPIKSIERITENKDTAKLEFYLRSTLFKDHKEFSKYINTY